jgi:hypothetical protein
MKGTVIERVLARMEATKGKMTDGDQRSALGMARTWLDKHEDIVRQSNFAGQFKRRDDLAIALVEIFRAGDRGECLAALQEARARLNKPFEDPSMATFRAARLKTGMVGSEKKNEKLAG